MSLGYTDEQEEMDELLAEIHREFRDGLPARLEQMRAALETLADGYDADASEEFYRVAHSLKGAAPSFYADGLVGPAAALAETGQRWYEGGATDRAELATAFEDLERLTDAVERFVSRMERGVSG
jgi:HPt (histidine-containing phosphotransfer) domain-containing protein